MEYVVDRFIETHQLLKERSTVVLGVSGGPDSMALLHYFLQKRAKWQLRIVVAHVNHMLRGKQSKEDYMYVEQFCRNHNILFEGAHIDVNAYKRKHQLTTQMAARECRYQFFAGVMEKFEAEFLALGHHGDDQIETMLMRQVRGAIGYSRAGIPVKRPFATGMIIRPFLCLEKADIEQYIEKAGIIPRRDPSNEQDEYVRNRFRHVVLPFLKRENPKVHKRFQRQSELLLEDEELLLSMAKQQFHQIVKRKENGEFIVDVNDFQVMAVPLQRRVIQLILNYLYHFERTDVTNAHIDQILHLFYAKHPSRELHLPANVHVIRSYDRVTFTYIFSAQKASSFFYRVNLPFQIHLPDGVLIGDVTDKAPEISSRYAFVGDADEMKFPLTIRTRKAGDKMYPLGMKGSKKIKSIFIDEKIDKRKRDMIPIIEDANGNILWIVGVKRAKFGLVTTKTSQYVFIMYQANDGEDILQNGE